MFTLVIYNYIQYILLKLMLKKLTQQVLRGVQTMNIPGVDMTRFLNQSPGWEDDCKAITNNLRDYGVLYVKDPRADYSYNWKFIDVLQKYFTLRSAQLEHGLDGEEVDVVEFMHRLGIDKPFYDRFDDYADVKSSLPKGHQSNTPLATEYDPTIRYTWNMNNPKNPIPKEFPEFQHIVTTWGAYQRNCAFAAAEMLAVGLGLERYALRSLIEHGQILVSPPGVDIRNTKEGNMLTSFHRDFDLFTVHGKNRVPGLQVWTRDGQRHTPKIPEDHFLIHGGKQLEWYTGGYLQACFHEVVFNQQSVEARQHLRKNKRPQWRVSTPMFCHVEGSKIMTPLGPFRTPESVAKYPQIISDDYYTQELENYGRSSETEGKSTA